MRGISRSLVVIASLCTFNAAQAVDRDWNQAAGVQVFNTSTNWTPNGTPVAADNLAFPLNGDVDIFLGAPSVGNNITFTDGIVEFLDVGGSTLNSGGVVAIDDTFAAGLGDGAQVIVDSAAWDNVGDAFVGDAGFGSLTLNSSGEFRSEDIFIGNQAGSVGTVNVDGAGTVLQTDGLNEANGFFIGNAGTGMLNVTGGGLARIVNDLTGSIANFELGFLADGEGTLNISGSGSQVIAEDVLIGRSGTGQLNITGGGVLNQNISTSPDAFVALDVDSSGGVTVSGDNSQWQMARLEIGNFGNATLSIEDGGLVHSNSNDMVLADAGGTGKVAVFGTPDTGSGANISTLDVTNDLYVGSSGLGELRIGVDLDADLSNDPLGAGHANLFVGSDLRIGASAANQLKNLAYISGPNTAVTVAGVLYAGENGRGTLELRDGAILSAAAPRIGSGATSNGTLLVTGTGTTFSATSDMVVATNGTGTATVSDGAVLNTVGNFWIGYQGSSGGTFTVDAATLNVSTINTGNLQIGGRIDGSGGTGTLTVQNGGTLNAGDETYIGGNSTATGTLIVTGFGSTYDQKDGGFNDFLRIGYGGAGVAEVRDGGRIDAEGIVIGSLAGSAQAHLLVTGSNSGTPSTVDVDGYFYVGDGRKGTMTVEQGGQVRVATSEPAERLFIGDNNAADGSKLTVTGIGSRVDYHGTGGVSVGNAGGSLADPAVLEVASGAVFSAVQRNPDQSISSQAPIIVGDSTNGNGRINVLDAGSLVEASAIYVGDGDASSTGGLHIFGGTVRTTGELQAGSNGNGVGLVNVQGSTSLLDVATTLSLGDDFPGDGSATGSLSVGGGATVTNGGQAYIGHFNGSIGQANIGNSSPAISSWTIGGELTIAGTEATSQSSGSGELNVNAGGLVDITSNLRIRNLGDVNLNGGELRVGDEIIYTDAGSTFNFVTGTLRFTETGTHTLDLAQLDRLFGANPTVGADQHLAVDETAVLTTPLRLNGGTFSVGRITPGNLANLDWDAGALNVTAEALVVGVAGQLGASVVVDEDQALGIPNNRLNVDAIADLNIIRGELNVASATNNGLIVVSNTSSVDFDADDSGSGLTNHGDLVAIDSTIAGPVINNGGIEIVGAVNFSDGVSLTAGGSLGIDIGGVMDFDAVSVGGDASLGGTLNVGVDGFSLTAGNLFEIIDIAGTQSGTFTGLADGALVGNFGGVDLFIDYNAGDGNDVALFTSVVGLPGDFDNDGDVDGRDFLVWQRNPSVGDLADWQANYGTRSLASLQTVPEPSVFVLAVWASISWCVAGQWRKPYIFLAA